MAFEDYKKKDAVVLVFTGDGKGKTSASIGLMARALGRGWKVAYIQFIKHWTVGEHEFIKTIQSAYSDNLHFYKGGKGFYNAGELSAKGVDDEEHVKAAKDTYKEALRCATSGEYNLVICDEINNAVNDGLLKVKDQLKLINDRAAGTSLCFTGRNYAKELTAHSDIVTEMTKIKHHFDDKYLANEGIDY